ncbi:MAG: aminotransferase class I/II-fold pyridoxal phosphate-dependent enzyme [Candidatus Njordarchaeia archaeon]
MRIDPFLVERFMGEHEHDVELNIAETCVKPFTLGEFLSLVGEEDFFEKIMDLQLTYGYVEGLPELREAIASLYGDVSPDNVLISRGAIDANFLVFYTLVEPGDVVVSVFPAYQQLYSVPKSFGAKVKLWKLKYEEEWVPNLDDLNELVERKTKLIVINNPHNPTGAVFDEKTLRGVCEIAEDSGAYVLSDESYFGLWTKPDYAAPSMVDICDRTIVTRSFSKSLSLTGLRLGWIVVPDELIEDLLMHRDYTTISSGLLAEKIAYLAIKNIDKVYERSLNLLRRNFEILKNWVEGESLVEWVPPKGSSVAFIRYLLDIPSEELALGLKNEKGVFVVPSSCFEMEGFVRVGYGNDTEILERGLKRFSEFLDKYK